MKEQRALRKQQRALMKERRALAKAQGFLATAQGFLMKERLTLMNAYRAFPFVYVFLPKKAGINPPTSGISNSK